MVASLRFMSSNKKEKENIEAAISGSVGVDGKFGVGVEGNFKRLRERTNGLFRIEYSIYATSLLDKTPGSIEEFLKAVEDFPKNVSARGSSLTLLCFAVFLS